MKPKRHLFIAGAVCLLGFAGYQMYRDETKAYRFNADGVVVHAEWNTNNHGMSLFRIRQKDGSEKMLHHHRVILNDDQIQVSDSFHKRAKTKLCLINGVEVRCVR